MSAPRTRVEIDRERCMGAGVCSFHAPGTFDVADDMKVRLLEGGDDPLEAIRTAVEACPTRALRLIDDEEAPK